MCCCSNLQSWCRQDGRETGTYYRAQRFGRGLWAPMCCIRFYLSRQYYYVAIVQINTFRPSLIALATESFSRSALAARGWKGARYFLVGAETTLGRPVRQTEIKARNMLIVVGNNKRLSVCETKSGEESLKVILVSKEETSNYVL